MAFQLQQKKPRMIRSGLFLRGFRYLWLHHNDQNMEAAVATHQMTDAEFHELELDDNDPLSGRDHYDVSRKAPRL